MFKLAIIATRNIFAHRMRAFLLGAAITVVSAILTLLLGLSAAFERNLFETGTALFSGHVNVAGFNKISLSSATPIVKNATELIAQTRSIVGDDAEYIFDRVTAFGKIISDTASIQVPLWGVDLATDHKLRSYLKLTTKPEFQGIGATLDTAGKAGCLMIFESQAKKLGVTQGDGITLLVPTMRNQNNTRDLKVCGIFKNVGSFSNFSAFVNKQDAIEVYQLDNNTTGFIMIFLKDVTKANAVENKLRTTLAQKGNAILEKDPTPFWMKFDKISNQDWIGEKLDLSTWEDNLSFVKWVVQAINGISVLLVAVILVSIGLGITNALGMAVRERTGEIGTLRAIGMQQSGVMQLFLLEAVILALMASLAGVLIATTLAAIVNRSSFVLPEAFQQVLIMDTLQLSIHPAAALFSVAMVTLFAVAGAFFPAWRASRMRPVQALGHSQ
jgi:putative ABC transport system permease protein